MLELRVVVHVLQRQLGLREVMLRVQMGVQILLEVLHGTKLVQLLHQAQLRVLAKVDLMAPHDIIDARTDVSSAHEDLVLALGVQLTSLVHLVNVDLGKATALALVPTAK